MPSPPQPALDPTERVLVAGLGNPGPKYAGTRHNIGFEVVDLLAERWGVRLTEKKFNAILGAGEIAGARVLLMKPQTYMNRSGDAVGPAAGFYRLPPQQVVAVHDELELPLGRLRIKQGGGHGGHNGLRSLDVSLPSSAYFRVRVGIDRPAVGSVSDWVLSGFRSDEKGLVAEVVETSADALEALLREGLQAVQNRFHALDLRPPPPA